jgi:proteasome lid subunit RPN8/RPN11
LDIPQEFADAIVTHSLEEDPDECCGILASKDGKIVKHYRITNSEHSPFRYSMDSKELFHAYRNIEDSGWDLAVIYHSHTHSPAYPSATDVRLATWPDAYYVLVSLMDKQAPDIRAYSIVNGQVTEDTVTIS